MLLAAITDLFQGLDAIGNERRAHHQNLFHAAFSQLIEARLSVGFDPFGAPQARLERHRPLALRQPHAFGKLCRRTQALAAITGGDHLRRRTGAAITATLEAVTGVELLQMPFRQAMKAHQQVIEILLQMRPGRGHQRIEVFRLVVERLEYRQLHVEVFLAYHAPGLFYDRSRGAVGELWIKRRQGDSLVPRRDQAHQRRFDRRLAVTHRQFDRAVLPLTGHRLLQATAEHHQRRALVPPDRGISMGRLLGTLDQDQRHQQPSNRPWQVDHVRVHQKLIEVAAHIRHRGGGR
ncbi:hypothetical protein D3C85_1070990 [compost metagenome]